MRITNINDWKKINENINTLDFYKGAFKQLAKGYNAKQLNDMDFTELAEMALNLKKIRRIKSRRFKRYI